MVLEKEGVVYRHDLYRLSASKIVLGAYNQMLIQLASKQVN